MQYAYPCNITRDEEEQEASGREAYVVTFPDIEGAITGGWSWDEAVEMAKDCLGVALGSFYMERRKDIPKPSPLAEGQVLIPVPPLLAAKLALYEAMREQKISKVALAKRLGIHENAVRRIVSPGHRSHLSQVEKALQAVGVSVTLSARYSSGNIPLRISPEVHRAATEAASAEGKSLNAWLAEVVEQAAERESVRSGSRPDAPTITDVKSGMGSESAIPMTSET